MQSYDHLDQAALMDALSDYTSKYSRMLSDGGNSEEINRCRDVINSIMWEISSRKKTTELNNRETNRFENI
jgi:hypothetical protein